MGKVRGNGEGSITQRPDGLWEARLTLSGDRRKSFYSKSLQVVASKLVAPLVFASSALIASRARRSAGYRMRTSFEAGSNAHLRS